MAQSLLAASLILWLEGSPPKLLMVERERSMAFGAGTMVFPGGRVDPDDHHLANGSADTVGAATRIAAIRETLEETGIAVAIEPLPDTQTAQLWREALRSGTCFSTLLKADGHHIAFDALTGFAHWHPPENGGQTRTFDTYFYLAQAPQMAMPTPDGSETVAALWMNTAELLADADAGRRRLMFPTRRNLERLATLPDLACARAHAASIPVCRIQPFIEHREDGDWICIPEDVGYPITSERMATRAPR